MFVSLIALGSVGMIVALWWRAPEANAWHGDLAPSAGG
jgi:hypothetical protein